jgi:hypothetical protein
MIDVQRLQLVVMGECAAGKHSGGEHCWGSRDMAVSLSSKRGARGNVWRLNGRDRRG